MWLKRYIQKCTLSHVLILMTSQISNNTKAWISWEQNIAFLWNKKKINLCLRWHILRIYRFVAEVTFKRKCLKSVKQPALSDQPLHCNCAITFNGLNILATDFRRFKLILRESFLIKCDKPILNRAIKSFRLELFDYDDSFISNITWLSGLFLICNRNFIVCIDRVSML